MQSFHELFSFSFVSSGQKMYAIFLITPIFAGSNGFLTIAPVVLPLTFDVFISSVVNKYLIMRAQKFFLEQLLILTDDILSMDMPIDAARAV